VPEPTLPFATRLWFAWICFFRVLFDGAFAERAWEAREPKALPAAKPEPRVEEEKPAKIAAPEPPSASPALSLLALFQREGRLVDFLEQDITAFGDAEIGAVARVVHDGCAKALHDHMKIEPVRDEEEGAPVTLEAGFSPSEIKLSGNVGGSAPYNGILRHRGWRAADASLPTPVAGHDERILAPAEVEL
jgi:hypothetical protein